MATAAKKVRFVCVSDTHNHAPGEGYTLPAGNVLIHAGDLTNEGTYGELRRAIDWIQKANFAVKIVIAGNHDRLLDATYFENEESDSERRFEIDDQRQQLMDSLEGIVYLQHSSAVVQLPDHGVSFRVFGSPYSPVYGDSLKWAFQYEQQADILWSALPTETGVLITHTPPAGHCDASSYWTGGGCPSLNNTVRRVRPALHICGHCHEGRGARVVRWATGNAGKEEDDVGEWEDTSIGTKKQALLDLTGSRNGKPLEVGKETAIINASVMATSRGMTRGKTMFNKPIVVDVKF